MHSLASAPKFGGVAATTSPGVAGNSGTWRRNRFRASGCSVEELRARWRERESALRHARRLQQLVSKRLLCDDILTDEGQVAADSKARSPFSEKKVSQLLRNIQSGTEDQMKSLRSLRRELENEGGQQKFIRLEDGMHVLIGLFTSNLADLQMEAARCLHQLSHSSDPDVVEACLPATAYLLTYLSGHSIVLAELCLYTLGNLVVETKAAQKQLLLQGLIPVLASCIQSPHVAVQEGVGYVLSQLLQSKEAPAEVIPLVLDSALFPHILRLVCCNLDEGMGAAVEFAWSLHYIICSRVNNSLLISLRTVPTLVQLLLELASTMSTSSVEGVELLVCPVVRCIGNLLAEDETSSGGLPAGEECLLRAVFVFIQYFLPKHLFVVQECLWLLNNLTADNTILCSVLLNLDFFPSLLHLLHTSKLAIWVLTVLCNIAAKGPALCQIMHQKAVLPSLIHALAFSHDDVVGQDLELLHLLFLHWPEAATDFVTQLGLQALQQHQGNQQLQERVTALIRTASQLAPPTQACPFGALPEELQMTSFSS